MRALPGNSRGWVRVADRARNACVRNRGRPNSAPAPLEVDSLCIFEASCQWQKLLPYIPISIGTAGDTEPCAIADRSGLPCSATRRCPTALVLAGSNTIRPIPKPFAALLTFLYWIPGLAESVGQSPVVLTQATKAFCFRSAILAFGLSTFSSPCENQGLV